MHEKESLVKEKVVDILVGLKEGIDNQADNGTNAGDHQMVELFSNMITKEKLYMTAEQALKQIQDEIRRGL